MPTLYNYGPALTDENIDHINDLMKRRPFFVHFTRPNIVNVTISNPDALLLDQAKTLIDEINVGECEHGRVYVRFPECPSLAAAMSVELNKSLYVNIVHMVSVPNATPSTYKAVEVVELEG